MHSYKANEKTIISHQETVLTTSLIWSIIAKCIKHNKSLASAKHIYIYI